MRLFTAFKKVPTSLAIGTSIVPVKVRPHQRSTRFSLRWNAHTGEVLATVPIKHSSTDLICFIEQSKPWIKKQLEKTLPIHTYHDGMMLPLLGKMYELRHRPSSRMRFFLAEDHLLLHAPQTNFDRHVAASLYRIAHTFLKDQTIDFAQQMGKSVARVSIKDPKTRWGSCSSNGTISYSWRLILAPKEVAHYVCAHETAHLIEMNHSKAFWRIVEELCPHHKESRIWLKTHGKSLFQYAGK